jgi:N-formylglutamate amidohydrolase
MNDVFAALLTLIAPPTPPLVTVQEGTLPIILSAPHGGGAPLPGVPPRLGVGVSKFTTVRDTSTDRLAEKLAAAIEKRMGGRPFVVIARFSRRHMDANREAKNAFEHPLARPYYDTYHNALADARKAVVERWGRGLLLDLHAQGAKRDTVFRGTNNGKSVTHLTDRFGRGAFVGPKSVLGVLEKKGYAVFPRCDSEEKENPSYGGGWITQRYGSRDGGTLDAIQLETGGDHRGAKNIDRFAADLADAVAVFAAEFLPAAKSRK